MPPAGYKRSRALWDETRRPDSSSRDLIRAILYEIQPLRFSKTNQRQMTQQLSNVFSTLLVAIRSFPGMVAVVLKFLRVLKFRHWLLVGGIVLYYYFVRLMHRYVLNFLTIIKVSILFRLYLLWSLSVFWMLDL